MIEGNSRLSTELRCQRDGNAAKLSIPGSESPHCNVSSPSLETRFVLSWIVSRVRSLFATLTCVEFLSSLQGSLELSRSALRTRLPPTRHFSQEVRSLLSMRTLKIQGFCRAQIYQHKPIHFSSQIKISLLSILTLTDRKRRR